MRVTELRAHLRNDLKEEGLSIPCQYQDGCYLGWDDIEHSDIIGSLKEGSQYALLLPYQNGVRSIAIVDSIDLDFTVEPEPKGKHGAP